MKYHTPCILSMDTATPCSSVAITRGTREDGQVLASLSLSGNVTHSRRLLSSVEWLLQETGVDWPDIDGVGVSLGPGSFTGLRIGMATAKGLAGAAEKKLIGISTLDSLASKCVTDRLICSLLDARKKEVYVAFYRLDANGRVERMGDISVTTPAALTEYITEPVLMVGDGASTYQELFLEMLGDRVSFAPAHLHEPGAAALGMLACELYLKNDLLDIGEAVPIYIRSSDAELNLLKKKEKEAAAHQGNPQ